MRLRTYLVTLSAATVLRSVAPLLGHIVIYNKRVWFKVGRGLGFRYILVNSYMDYQLTTGAPSLPLLPHEQNSLPHPPSQGQIVTSILQPTSGSKAPELLLWPHQGQGLFATSFPTHHHSKKSKHFDWKVELP